MRMMLFRLMVSLFLPLSYWFRALREYCCNHIAVTIFSSNLNFFNKVFAIVVLKINPIIQIISNLIKKNKIILYVYMVKVRC